MGFQALFKFVECWRAPDVVKETVPSSWGGDGKRALAEFQTSRVSKPGFLLQTRVFGFGNSQTRVSGSGSGSGLEVTLRSLQIGGGSAVDGWTGWANFSSSLSITKLLQNCKYCRFDTLILIDLLMRQIVRLLWSCWMYELEYRIPNFGWHAMHGYRKKWDRPNELLNPDILRYEPSHTQSSLQSAAHGTLFVPRTRL